MPKNDTFGILFSNRFFAAVIFDEKRNRFYEPIVTDLL